LIEINFHIDNSGILRVDVAPANELLGDFIQLDIVERVGFCRELIQAVDDAIAGKVEEFSRTGDTCTLTLTPEKARIDLEVVEPPPFLDLSLIDLKQALTKYLAFAEAQGWE